MSNFLWKFYFVLGRFAINASSTAMPNVYTGELGFCDCWVTAVCASKAQNPHRTTNPLLTALHILVEKRGFDNIFSLYIGPNKIQLFKY